MLEKSVNIGYSPGTGQVRCGDITFNEGDKNISYIQLQGELDQGVKVVMKVKPPQGKVVPVSGETVPYKNISHKFLVPINGPGKYQCELVLTYRNEVNVSNVFEYTVQKSL